MIDLPIKFRLKSSTGDKPASIRMIIFHRDFGSEGRFVYGTRESILPALFDPVTGRPVKSPDKLRILDKETRRKLILIESRLDSIQTTAREVLAAFSVENRRLQQEAFKQMLDEKLQRNPIRKAGKLLLTDYMDRYVEELRSGKRVTVEGNVLAEGSVKNYLTCLSQIREFEIEKRLTLTFEDINQQFYNSFVTFLNSKQYSPNTIGKHIARIKKIMRSAKEESLYKGNEHDMDYFRVLKVDTEHVYLNTEELKAVADLDLSENPELIAYRDVFLIGCHIAQRISDYKAIRPEHITRTAAGVPILKIIQKKTGETVLIPISSELNRLLKKYNHHPPIVHENNLNQALKIICKTAKIDTPVEIEKIRGGKKIRQVLPKYELIKSHTARRTGATLMYLGNVPTLDIMKVTGHKKESNFLKYICVTKEETANNLAQHSYFK